MADEPEPNYDITPHPDETDAEARLRWHEDPDNPFVLGDISLSEVKEAVENGWDEARSKDRSPEELLSLHNDSKHPMDLTNSLEAVRAAAEEK